MDSKTKSLGSENLCSTEERNTRKAQLPSGMGAVRKDQQGPGGERLGAVSRGHHGRRCRVSR